MSTALRFTSADLEVMPDDGKRYEIIDGELYVSKQPRYHHQYTCNEVARQLGNWSKETGEGRVISAPGVIFAEDDDVAGFHDRSGTDVKRAFITISGRA